MSLQSRFVKCPHCGTPVPWGPESKWRPFCSERCKLIDLGDWAAGRYRIESQEAPDAMNAPPESPSDKDQGSA